MNVGSYLIHCDCETNLSSCYCVIALYCVDDCVESMIDNSPQDLAAIKFACDGKTECEFTITGSAMPDCPSDTYSNYMTVYYDCQPGRATLIHASNCHVLSDNPTYYL